MTTRTVSWTIGAVVAALAAILFLSSGFRLFAVMTPSMGQTAPVGTMIAVHPAASYSVGEIISFDRNDRVYSHRIVEVNANGSFVTKGDLNSAADPLPVTTAQVIGRVVWIAPGLGWLWQGLPWLIVGCLIVFVLSLFRQLNHPWEWVVRISGWTLVFCLVAFWLRPWVSLAMLGWVPADSSGVDMHVVNTGLFPLDVLGQRLVSGQDTVVHVTQVNESGEYFLTPGLGFHWWEQLGVLLVCLVPLWLSFLITDKRPVEPARAIREAAEETTGADEGALDPLGSTAGNTAAQPGTTPGADQSDTIDLRAAPMAIPRPLPVATGTGHKDERPERLRRLVLIGAVVLAIIISVTVVTFTTTSGAFTAKVLNSANTARTRTFFKCRNAISSLGIGGTTVAFAMGSAGTRSEPDLVRGTNNNGIYNTTTATKPTYGCQWDPHLSVTFNGTSQCLASRSTYANPQTFSLEAWFSTTSTKAGKVIGFGATQFSATESTYDRHVYVDNNGRVVFGVYTGGYMNISSPAGTKYNDGNWHHVIATYVGGTTGTGTKLYLDGALVASNSSYTNAEGMTGYWKVGCGNLTDWPNAAGTTLTTTTSAAWFAGQIQYAAVYSGGMSATVVLEHYLAGVG